MIQVNMIQNMSDFFDQEEARLLEKGKKELEAELNDPVIQAKREAQWAKLEAEFSADGDEADGDEADGDEADGDEADGDEADD